MLPITAAQVRAAALSRANEANLNSVMVSLDRYADDLGMSKPHILAQFLPQLMHESGDFRFDREVWGPTPTQKGYDTRTDNGNTPAADGDGHLYRGRTAMQLTGKSNYRQFRNWCRNQGYNPPDFVAEPDLVNTVRGSGTALVLGTSYWNHNIAGYALFRAQFQIGQTQRHAHAT